MCSGGLCLQKCTGKRQKSENQFFHLNTINSMSQETEQVQPELTFGQKAVGIKFNPSQQDDVDFAKQKVADLIDLVEQKHSALEKPSWFQNVFRTAAFNALIAAQMAVVKYLTWKE